MNMYYITTIDYWEITWEDRVRVIGSVKWTWDGERRPTPHTGYKRQTPNFPRTGSDSRISTLLWSKLEICLLRVITDSYDHWETSVMIYFPCGSLPWFTATNEDENNQFMDKFLCPLNFLCSSRINHNKVNSR